MTPLKSRFVVAVMAAMMGMGCVAHGEALKADDFIGTWYGSFGAHDFKIDVTLDGESLKAAILASGPKRGVVALEVTTCELREDDLLIEALLEPGRPDNLRITIRPPKDEMIGTLKQASVGIMFPLIVTKTAPYLEQRFAMADPETASPERLRELRKACADHLHQIGLALKEFAAQTDGERYPLLDPRPGRLMFQTEDLFPAYLEDPAWLVCPADANTARIQPQNPKEKATWFVDNSSYWYLGYALPTEDTAMAFVDAYRARIKAGETFSEDLKANDGTVIYRLAVGVQDHFVSDTTDPTAGPKAMASIPVMIGRPGLHPLGANVAFLDGHVEFREYPGPYPMTERFIEALLEIDKLRTNPDLLK
ncbi:MAG TPA: hypothetical protein PLO37_14875 [Candidatus Hydrogenedentes bacterium]|nr:hypothetical protein [Candidatus Hydrogenedentota bacterium]HPG68130.1 hypothetical protein [Candidatus Hydrogenedentota bacterium]